jgi:anti-sigma factor ChrR (cupin superfamily)
MNLHADLTLRAVVAAHDLPWQDSPVPGIARRLIKRDGDETGHYGPGTYLKNPEGSAHAPYSVQGCTLFVKLRHLDPADQQSVVVETPKATWYPGMVPGLSAHQPFSVEGCTILVKTGHLPVPSAQAV